MKAELTVNHVGYVTRGVDAADVFGMRRVCVVTKQQS